MTDDDRANSRPSKVPWPVLGVILVGGLFSGLIAVGFDRQPPPNPPETQPNRVQTGQISITSSPLGAVVRINGESIRLGNGDEARTPISALTELRYGKVYEIELNLDGYEGFAEKVSMNEVSDRSTVHATLARRP